MILKLPKIGLLFAVILLATACQKEEFLMSEDKIDSQLQNTWDRVEMTTTSTAEINWKFNEGKLYLSNRENLLAEGTYSVETSMTKVKINISGFPDPGYEYMNGKWQVITLDDDILVIAEKDHGGTLQMEFTRRK